MKNPRFRTANEAGKYISALPYLRGHDITAEDYGAVPEAILNPDYKYARYEVVYNDGSWNSKEGYEIRDLHATQEAKIRQPVLKTSEEWYKEWSAMRGAIIVFADGWDDVPDFNEYWNYAKISEDVFMDRLTKSVIYA